MKEEFVSLPLQLEVPQSDGEFKCGLMFRESLEQDRGMLFIFESDDYWTFHMKNTFIPLDIAFIKEDGTIDSIKELDPMNPIPVYPDSEIRYAVEVNRGWFAENDVNVGDALLEEVEELNEVKDKKGKGSGTKDACYYKVKSRYSVWPSAYASGALVKCRKVGAANWGNKSESVEYEVNEGAKKIVGKVVGRTIKKIGDTMVVKGGRKVRVASKGAPSADYGRGTFLTRQKEKLAKQKAAKKIQPDKFKEKGFEIRPVEGGGGTTIQRVNKYGVQPGIEPNTVATDFMAKKQASKLKVDPTKGKSPTKRTSFQDKDFKPKFEEYKMNEGLGATAVKAGVKVAKTVGKKAGKVVGKAAEFTKNNPVKAGLTGGIAGAAVAKKMQKNEHYSWRDSFDLDEMTIAQRNSKQNQNKVAAQNRAKEMAKTNIQKFGGTASAAAANKQAMRDKIKVQNNPTQGKPMASNPQGMRQQGVGKSANDLSRHSTGSSAAQKPAAKPGLLSRIGSGIKRVAGGVADAATGNRFDFDKRGGQRPAPQAARGGNVRGSGARANRQATQAKPVPQAAGGGQKVAAPVSKAVPTGSGGVRTSRPAPQAQQSSGGGASASRKIDGAGLANTMRAQNNQSGVQRRPMSPEMQKRVAQTQVGNNLATAVNKLKPQAGQTVTTKPNAQGGTTATLTGGTGSVSGNVNKAKRIVKNQNVGPTTVGKITGGQGVSDF